VSQPRKIPKAPPFVYDLRNGSYWIKVAAAGRFISLDSSSMKLHLRFAGFDGELFVGNLNEIEACLHKAQTERAVDFCGPLAGHKVGMFETSAGVRVLVTQAPGRIFDDPSGPVECPNLERFLGELFGDDQLPSVLAWCKYACESLRRGDFRPGQMLLLAGPAQCGKSLFQALVTELLGGRAAKPYRYMIGQTAFNEDLARAEHLVIEDENPSTDIRSRREFGTAIKDFSVNREMSIHGKGKTALQLPTYRRITCSVNDEPENLMICPPLDDSIRDKIMLLRCNVATVGEDRLETWKTLAGEIPAFRCFLARHRVPPSIKDPRFGVKAFHHPDLLEALSSIAPENRLLNLIDEVLFGPRTKEVSWEGTAEQLEAELRRSPQAFAAERLFYFATACGVYLGRVAKKHPKRVELKRTASRRVWTIRAPEPD